MGVYIKGMTMPTSCKDCPCFCEEYFYCRAKEGDDIGLENRPSDCPLVPVPAHGRLIDADALKMCLVWAKETAEWAVPALRAVLVLVDEIPTIIPAEEGE